MPAATIGMPAASTAAAAMTAAAVMVSK
jgi:hypothetical protein